MIKKIALMALVAGFAGQAFAAAPDACTGTAGKVVIKTVSTDAVPMFIKTDFPMVCSSNVVLNYGENAVVAWIAAASTKGKNYFVGHSDGGAPKVSAACAATGCLAADVTGTALPAAKLMATGGT